MAWYASPTRSPDVACAEAARQRQLQLTKPSGSLGVLENIAITLAGLQATATPSASKVHITVFAADHGVGEENVSAFPQSVTAEMIRNFARGGAAISVLASELGAELSVVNLGTVVPLPALDGVIHQPLGPGTANFTRQAAMSETQFDEALEAGKQAVERARATACEIFIGGEMGIANTTAASALACALLHSHPIDVTGPGTGLGREGVSHKARVVSRALEVHQAHSLPALALLRCLGGFEIVALAGSYIRAAQLGIPVIVDGFISSVAALYAVRLNSGVRPWLLPGHQSAEPAHQQVLAELALQPLLQLDMRLGEASGAATAVPLLRLACALHNQMATFEQAAVSTQLERD